MKNLHLFSNNANLSSLSASMEWMFVDARTVEVIIKKEKHKYWLKQIFKVTVRQNGTQLQLETQSSKIIRDIIFVNDVPHELRYEFQECSQASL